MSDCPSPSLQERALGAVFNRKNASRLFAVGFLVDQFGYAGAYGGSLLRTNDFTRPAAIYYEGLGMVMNFSWNSLKDLASKINKAVQRPNGP